MLNVYFETYGCTNNQAESEIMAGLLSRAGLNIVKNPDIADIAIINTCIVKGPTEKRMEGKIQKLNKKFSKFIVAGCMPEVYPETIRKLAPNSSLISTNHITEIVNVVKKLLEGKRAEFIGYKKELKICLPRIKKVPIISIVPILSGCGGNCAFCITKCVKGPLFSYPQAMILKDIKQNLKDGCKEIWLTSQDNAAYGLDSGRHELPELLKKIIALKGNFSVRVGMMNPSSLLPVVDKVIDCYKNKKILKFLHLPVQSGSNKILKRMNRNYKVKDFISIIGKFRKQIPSLSLATDIIVGFPGESEKDFQDTLKLIQKIMPEVLNISKFWPMPGTSAADMKQIPVSDIKRRVIRLMNIHKTIKKKLKK